MSTMEQVEVGKYQPYPEYKDSGVEWLGLVPKHWDVCGFKRHILRNDGGVWGDEPSGVDDTMVLRSTEQTVDGRWIIEQPAFRQLSQSEKVSALLIENDLVITKSSGSANHIGKTALVTSKLAALQCCYSNFMQRVRTHSSFLPKLAWYVMNNRIAREQFNVASNSTIGLANLNGGMIGQLMVVVPPIAEQQTIVAFLDYETARIDKLIAQQQRLIELLKEKRQAVISHAVTKGLNPDAPMKDSGVEWLGEVPEHWEILKGSWLGRLFGSEAVEDADVVLDGDVAFVKVSTLSLDELSPQDPEWFVSPQTASRVRAKRDFIAFPKRGAAIFTNKVNIVPYCSVIDPNLMGWEVKKTINTTYLANCLKIRRLDDIADVSTVPQINNKHISPQRFPVPPRIEQDEIVERIEEGILLFDKLLLKAGDAILLMQERRTALISSAVTGKIDLRDWVAPTEEVSNG
ncbi:TPA: hypothetical protein R7H00_005118 [Klebsiella pneumoniae]|nr:hypothetical protein [Klebsiella pneumoniae]